MNPLASLSRFEFAGARRARTVTLFAAGFTAAAVLVAAMGLSSGGVLAIQGFARTSISLMQLVLWVVPLMGLLVGASVGAESLELEFEVALPVRRSQIVVARWVAWSTVLGGAMTIGLGAAGILIGLMAGPSDTWRYLRLVAVSNLLLAACVALGIVLGTLARTRIRAMAFSLLAWFILVIGMDLVAIGALSVLPRGEAGWGLTLLLMLNPVDSARALSIALLQADVVSGPTGAAIHQVLGGWGLWALVGAMIAWVLGPLYLAGRAFRRADL